MKITKLLLMVLLVSVIASAAFPAGCGRSGGIASLPTVSGGNGNVKARVSFADTRTGQRKWRRGRYGFGQAVAVASTGQILVTTERGEVVAIDASPESSVERGRVKVLGSKTWNHPVVIGNRMYLRNAEEMVCLQLKRE